MAQIGFVNTDDLDNDFWGPYQTAITMHGEKPFIYCKNGSISFAEMDRRANIIANELASKGLTNRGIGIYSIDPFLFVPAMYGIWKSGNYFAYLDTSFPTETLKPMMEDASITIILTDSEQIRKLPEFFSSFNVINNDQILHSGSSTFTPTQYSPEQWAQILFTSGSTGRPKGNIENFAFYCHGLEQHNSQLQYTPKDKALEIAPFNFPSPHVTVGVSVFIGCSIYLFNPRLEGFGTLPDLIRAENFTLIKGVPTIFRNLTAALSTNETFPSVRDLPLYGEKLLPHDLEVIQKHFPNVESMVTAYGLSEAFGLALSKHSIKTLLKEEVKHAGKINPFPIVKFWDEDHNEVPYGEIGEIVAYTNRCSQGYVNQPDLTAERFIDDTQNPGWKWVMTGDIGRATENGELIVLGRKDNMVKVRGIRIELTTLESKILAYPGIRTVASKVVDLENGSKKLASYFTADEGQVIPIGDLRKYLTDSLPIQQLPNYFIQLPTMPLTSTGKVSIKDLPMPDLKRPALTYPYMAPSSENQKMMTIIWEDVLSVTGIGLNDDFFDLGGDSLLGLLLFMEVEQKFGVNLPLNVLLKAATISSLVDIIEKKDQEKFNLPYIQFHEGGDLAPIFFIPGRGGYPTRIMHLQKKLDPRHPIFALYDSRLVKGLLDPDPLLDASLFFLSLIEELAPERKPILIGESLGGKIAYEVAALMVEKGAEPPLVMLLDTYMNYTGNKQVITQLVARNDFGYYFGLIKKHVSILVKADPAGRKDYIKFYLGLLDSKMKKAANKPQLKEKPAADLFAPNNVAASMDDLLAMMSFKHQSIQSKVVLFKAMRDDLDVGPANGWDSLQLEHFHIEPLNCYHGSILFEPTVSMLAEKAKSYMAQY